MTGNLIEFLRARLDDDEARAKQGAWAAEFLSQGGSKDPGSKRAYGKAVMREGGWPPSRVLAEVDAKRRIIKDCVEMLKLSPVYPDDSIGEPGESMLGDFARWTLANIALPYAGHPDYRPEWAPQ